MIRNYLLVAWRNLWKDPSFSLIKIFGLAMGISLFLVLLSIINDQMGFDRFHPNADQVFRVNTEALRKNGGTESYATSPYPLGAYLKSNYPSIEKIVRLNRSLRGRVTYDGKELEVNGFFTDPEFFEVFGFELLLGNKAEALKDPNSIILTQETARRFFGNANPVGKTLLLEGKNNFTVAGLIKDPPGKTHLEFDLLGSNNFLTNHQVNTTGDWLNYYNTYLYLQFRKGAPPELLGTELRSFAEKQYANLELESRDKGYAFFLQALNKIVPGPIISNNMGSALPTQFLWVMGIFAAIVLISAAFNYNSLSLAKSLSRAKEIGIRKTSGALRHQLIIQFLIESVVTSLLAFIVASGVFSFFLKPFFKSFTIFQELRVELKEDILLYLIFAVLCVLVGLITGLFPALYLSSISISRGLKNLQHKTWLPRIGWRRVLLVVQFSAALLFIVLLLNLYRQMNYVTQANYGFQKENVVNISLQRNDYNKIKETFAQNHHVVSISGISHSLGTSRDRSVDVRIKSTDDKIDVRDYTIDENYIDNLGLELVAGKNFSADLPQDREIFAIVNQNFLNRFQLGTPAEAIGKSIMLEDSINLAIVGVVKDFHFRPFTYNIEPLLLRYNPAEIQQLNVRLSGQNNEEAIASLKESWKRIDKSRPISYQFMSDELRDSYREFMDLSSLLGLIAFMAVAVACLGFLGLVLFMLKQRTKEISIRKVLGANLVQLMTLLSRSFLKIFIITCLVGLPLSIVLNEMVMQTFAYRVNLITGYISGLLLLFFIAFFTIGSQIIRAAIANPVKSLRTE